jgi:hypothetical protein
MDRYLQMEELELAWCYEMTPDLLFFSSCIELFSYRDDLESELCACMQGLSLAFKGVTFPW